MTTPQHDGAQHDAPETRPTPMIEVRPFAAAAAALGGDRIEVAAGSLEELVSALAERTDAAGARVIARSSLLVNSVAQSDRSTILHAGDRVDVLPPFAGG